MILPLQYKGIVHETPNFGKTQMTGGVYSQARARLFRRATGPFGPIGLPGQGCEAACWHICKSFFGGQNCEAECRESCINFVHP